MINIFEFFICLLVLTVLFLSLFYTPLLAGFLLLTTVKKSKRTLESTENYCKAQKELMDYYFDSSEISREKIKELREKADKSYQTFLKYHPSLLQNKSTH